MAIDKQKFFEGFKPWFKRTTGRTLSARQVQAIEFLLDRFSTTFWDVRWIAYALATIHVETAFTYEPIVERGSKFYFQKYDINYAPKKAKELGNVKPGDGYLFRGRGYVQITGRKNYAKVGIRVPDAALEPVTAFDIMCEGMTEGIFTGKKLSDYINSTKTDYKGARRIINGQDRAVEIAGYARDIENILKLSAAANDRPVNEESEAKIDNPSTVSATDPSVQQQKPLLDRLTSPLINVKSKFDALGVDPGSVSKSSAVMTLTSKVGGWFLVLVAAITDHPVWFIVGGLIVLAAIFYFASAKRNATARVVGK